MATLFFDSLGFCASYNEIEARSAQIDGIHRVVGFDRSVILNRMPLLHLTKFSGGQPSHINHPVVVHGFWMKIFNQKSSHEEKKSRDRDCQDSYVNYLGASSEVYIGYVT